MIKLALCRRVKSDVSCSDVRASFLLIEMERELGPPRAAPGVPLLYLYIVDRSSLDHIILLASAIVWFPQVLMRLDVDCMASDTARSWACPFVCDMSLMGSVLTTLFQQQRLEVTFLLHFLPLGLKLLDRVDLSDGEHLRTGVVGQQD
ncbi:hypothetical protein BHM03_00053673 [Ensete ventricosum]|nr:hypothetical protein BHM03_00053673 [Ensete ventricosum]